MEMQNLKKFTRREALQRIAVGAAMPMAAVWSSGCQSTRTAGPSSASAIRAIFGRMPDGREVAIHTLTNSQGASVDLTEYGATIVSIRVPDRSGNLTNVVYGADSLDGYLQGVPAASVIGRYANRIRNARFEIDGKSFQVTPNAGPHHIHGGREGFASKLWQSRSWLDHGVAYVEFRYRSVDGEEGFPGTLETRVTYSWSEQNELTLAYHAVTDRPTVVNLTNHAYFNLAGAGAGNVFDHVLEIRANQYTPGDASLIPTGEVASVVGTPLDFRQPHRIGERIGDIRGPNGYDHNFILAGGAGADGLRLAARVFEPQSGRVLTCHTTEPGLQLYTANHFDGVKQPKHGAFCLETQHYPDSPNLKQFPSPVVRPGKPFHSATQFQFSHRAMG